MLWYAVGYALSIYIPISFVCVVPYEAVRWAMIAVATVLSGLFLLLNFKGPIFDVAGAKCALSYPHLHCPPCLSDHYGGQMIRHRTRSCASKGLHGCSLGGAFLMC